MQSLIWMTLKSSNIFLSSYIKHRMVVSFEPTSNINVNSHYVGMKPGFIMIPFEHFPKSVLCSHQNPNCAVEDIDSDAWEWELV